MEFLSAAGMNEEQIMVYNIIRRHKLNNTLDSKTYYMEMHYALWDWRLRYKKHYTSKIWPGFNILDHLGQEPIRNACFVCEYNERYHDSKCLSCDVAFECDYYLDLLADVIDETTEGARYIMMKIRDCWDESVRRKEFDEYRRS